MADARFTLRLATIAELHIAQAIDDAAAQLYLDAGLRFDLADDHPFVLGERARWRRAAEGHGLYWAIVADAAVGFAAVNELDGHAHVEQISVRPEHGRRGVGRALLEHACALARARGSSEIWLTTYAHLPFNRPFYERSGFVVVPEHAWGAEARATIEAQRRVLPDPEQRVAMRRMLGIHDRNACEL